MIEIKRIFDAPVHLVWKAWTEPSLVNLWYGGDPNGIVLGTLIDLKVGGKYSIVFCDEDGTQHTNLGEFLIVETHSRLVYSWQWKSEPWHISELEVKFMDMGNQTKIYLVHRNLHPQSQHQYKKGWNGALDKFTKLLQITK